MMDLSFSGRMLMSVSLSGVYGRQLQVGSPPFAQPARAGPSPLLSSFYLSFTFGLGRYRHRVPQLLWGLWAEGAYCFWWIPSGNA